MYISIAVTTPTEIITDVNVIAPIKNETINSKNPENSRLVLFIKIPYPDIVEKNTRTITKCCNKNPSHIDTIKHPLSSFVLQIQIIKNPKQ